jgi:hypothetical protein
MKKITCCGKEIVMNKSKSGMYWLQCNTCGRRGKGITEDAAEKAFRAWKPAEITAQEDVLPTSPDMLPVYVNTHIRSITDRSARFVDSPALARLIKNNMRYVMTQKTNAWKKIWDTKEGQESIIYALEESLSLGAELGKMGDIIPFGSVVEFIPAVEAFQFAVTTGNSAPFEWINIEPIYKNDIVELSRVNGNFNISFKKILPTRGEVIAISVYGELKSNGIVAGEVYELDRLLEKAKQHSPSYRSYIRDMQAYEYAKSEGKVQRDANGREYFLKVAGGEVDKYFEQNVEFFRSEEKAGKLKKDARGEYAEKTLTKKDGTAWTKKIYRDEIENPGQKTEKVYLDEIVNPYEGPDRPEMLRKTAGKSFLSPYVKVRNAVAATEEIRKQAEEDEEDDIDDMLDRALDGALKQFDSPEKKPGSEDAEFEVVEEEGEEEEEAQKNEKENTLF